MAIKRISKKRKEDEEIYKVIRKEFLTRFDTCFIKGCGRKATTIEHTMGRVGYADDWARENKISLYLDVRHWEPCCLEHNLELERNTELSRIYQKSKIHNGTKFKTKHFRELED